LYIGIIEIILQTGNAFTQKRTIIILGKQGKCQYTCLFRAFPYTPKKASSRDFRELAQPQIYLQYGFWGYAEASICRFSHRSRKTYKIRIKVP